MVKDGMNDKLLSVNENYISFADRIFNKYKDLYTDHKDERCIKRQDEYGKSIYQ